MRCREGIRLHVGRRVARLRAAHGESLREAAQRTGVSHTTIARIEKGEVSESFHTTLRKIAEGYGVQMDFLLAGEGPRRSLDAARDRLAPLDRFRLYFAPPQTRSRLILDLLSAGAASGPKVDEQAWAGGARAPTGEVLSQLTGIPAPWFMGGSLDDEGLGLLSPEHISAYIRLARKAAEAGISPQMLTMAIDLLIMKQQQRRVAAG